MNIPRIVQSCRRLREAAAALRTTARMIREPSPTPGLWPFWVNGKKYLYPLRYAITLPYA